MRASIGVIVVATGLSACVGPPLPCATLSQSVQRPPEQVLVTAAALFEQRGYHAYRGNLGLVVATRSDPTFWTVPALAVGLVALPAFIVTWPVVSGFDHTLHKEMSMRWPARAFTWERSTYNRSTTIYLNASPREQGASLVTVKVTSPDVASHDHARQVMGALTEVKAPQEMRD